MGWPPDPLLLELFESLHSRLSVALEARGRLTSTDPSLAATPGLDVESGEEIARLENAVGALERALLLRHAIVVQ